MTTGGLLLHLSPFGFNDGMRGRHAFMADNLKLNGSPTTSSDQQPTER